MTGRGITTDNACGQGLTVQQRKKAARQLMTAAQAHKNASQWCSERSVTDPLTMDVFYSLVVSFEMVLLSVEQSLKLLLLLRYGIFKPIHNLQTLYALIYSHDKCGEDVVDPIVRRMNELTQADENIEEFSEKELADCLQDHNSSYETLRYFWLPKQVASEYNAPPVSQRDRQIMQSFAQSLIAVNLEYMSICKIGLIRVYLGDQLVKH